MAVPFGCERHPDGPFATLVRVATTCLDPRTTISNCQQVAGLEGDPEVQVFKAELRQALPDPGLSPGDELFEAVEYGDGSDESSRVA